MGTKIASLEIGLDMATGSAVSELNRFGGVVDKVTAQALRDLDRIDAEMKSVGGLDAATAGAIRLAEETAKTAVQMAREADRSERAGERIAGQLERQLELYGLTRAEVRALRAEEAAREADRHDQTELAGRIRGNESALSEREAMTARTAAAQADAEAAERLRMSTDSTYAATARLNKEIEESTRLYHAGATAEAEYMRQQKVLGERLRAVGSDIDQVEKSTARGRHTMMMFGMQLNDAATMAALGSNPMQIFASQAGQVAQVAQQAEGGVAGFARQLGALALRLVPLGAAAAVAGTMFVALNDRMEKDSGLKEYQASLGLTRKELEKMGPASVEVGDMMKGLFKTIGLDLDGTGSKIKGWIVEIGTFFGNVTKGIGSAIYGIFVGGYRSVVETWRQLPAALGDIFVQAVNGAIGSIEWLGNKIGSVLNWLGADFGSIALGRMKNSFAGSARDVGEAWARNLDSAAREGVAGVEKFMGEWTRNSQAVARERIAKEAAAVSLDRREREAAAAAKKALQEQEEAARKLAAELKALQSLYEGLEARFDPVGAANRGFVEALANIEKLRRVGKITAEEAGQWQYAAAREAAEKIAKLTETVEIPVKLDMPDVEAIDLDKLLGIPVDPFERLVADASAAAGAMAGAFGKVGAAIGDATAILADYAAEQSRIAKAGLSQEDEAHAMTALRIRSMTNLASVAKGFFAEGSRGYQAMLVAEKAMAAAQLARTAIDVAGGAARMFATMGPAGFAAVGAMVAVMAGLGFSGSGGVSKPPASNLGDGTVLGDASAQSESIRRGLDALKEVDDLTLTATRSMEASLRSIDSQLGGVASLIVRGGNVGTVAGVADGFSTNAIGSVLKTLVPIFGGALAGLFGTKTTVTGGGLYAGPQTLGSILGSGFDASTYSEVEKVKKFLGITTGRSTSTKYGQADAGLENQFTLILRDFAGAITAAAGPLGIATGDIKARLNGFVVDLGKIDLKGLSGAEIEEKLGAIFGATADRMAASVLPGLERFQRVGEGMFETLVRIASTAEAVTASLDKLGVATTGLGLDAKVALAGQFESLSAMTSAMDAYAADFYTKEERTAAQAARLGGVFTSLGVAMPDTLAAFRALVDAQDLTAASGRSAYATLVQLAPAFAELQSSLTGAKSAADVLAERSGLERKLLEMAGDTAAIRALDLAKLDASNRGLQEQVWAMEAAQEAVKAAEELRKAWSSVGDTILDEVKRIRGLDTGQGPVGFAALMGQFGAATAAARAGDMDAAKQLPVLSRTLLDAAAKAATSRQELDRVQAETAASLQATYAALAGYSDDAAAGPWDATAATMAQAATAATATAAATNSLAMAVAELRAEVTQLRTEANNGFAAVTGSTNRTARVLERVSGVTGGDAFAVGSVR